VTRVISRCGACIAGREMMLTESDGPNPPAVKGAGEWGRGRTEWGSTLETRFRQSLDAHVDTEEVTRHGLCLTLFR